MGLKITLKPNERVIIGGAVITNGATATHLVIENKVPVLRRKDILSEKDADTPCRRLYMAVQLIYIDEQNRLLHLNTYRQLSRGITSAVPSLSPLIEEISRKILDNRYYQALRSAKKIIAYEKEIIKGVTERNASIPKRRPGHHVGTRNRGNGPFQSRAQVESMSG